MRQNLENLLLILVGLAIVVALGWLTTRALESFFASAPPPEATVAAAEATSTAAATPSRTAATRRPTQEPSTPRPRATLRPTRVREREPEAPPPATASARPTGAPTATSGPTIASERWSAPREYRVESAAKLHERPEAASHVIARIRAGTIVTVVAEQGGWLRVESSLGQRGGWIEADLLRPIGRRP